MRYLALMFLGGVCLAQDVIDVKTYREAYKEGSDVARQGAFDYYLSGLAAAFSWSNTQLETSKPPRQALFCPPRKLALNLENYKSMIDAKIKKSGYEPVPEADATDLTRARQASVDRISVELLLLDALIEAFPCPKAQTVKK